MNDTTKNRITIMLARVWAFLVMATAACCLISVFTGCAMYDASIVAIHDSIDAVKKGDKPTLPPIITNALPTTAKAEACGCDLSKPLALFASPVHGTTEKEIGEGWLRPRWVSGTDDSCGGLPHDVRPRAIAPSGKSFGWKYAITKGFIKIRFEGDNMALSCGDVTVDGLTQRWHFVGTSDHTTRKGWRDCKPGEFTPIAKHAWFEVRNK